MGRRRGWQEGRRRDRLVGIIECLDATDCYEALKESLRAGVRRSARLPTAACDHRGAPGDVDDSLSWRERLHAGATSGIVLYEDDPPLCPGDL